mgnify:CR=1 FL=1|tara:strand:- start:341 stop:703 length:363 start_codon:yes stop_codon:yes gene_type:complete
MTKRAFCNFRWTEEAIRDWEDCWASLWESGYKWEWSNRDLYARRRGDSYDIFLVHNDAHRLDMAIPLPQIDTIRTIHRELIDFDGSRDARRSAEILALWLVKHSPSYEAIAYEHDHEEEY